MTVFFQTVPKKTTEIFDGKDRKEIHDIIANLRRSYVERLHDASQELHHAQRQVNRANHEVTRLTRHLARIDAFCKQHNIEEEHQL